LPNNYPTEDILGSLKPVKEFAAFGEKNKEFLKTIYDKNLLEYCDTQTFTPDMLKAFRFGLDIFPKFFEACEKDIESYLMETEKENENKSVG
jgi:hypothetical protein